MTTYNYEKHIEGGTTFNEGDVDCDRADISATGSFIPAPTYTARTIKCAKDATVWSSGSATVVIDNLIADTAVLTCKDSATLRIKSITARIVTIEAEASANLRMEAGEIEIVAGTVKKSSYACFAGKIAQQDNVDAETASTWSVGRCL
jgi:hypothetical protein